MSKIEQNSRVAGRLLLGGALTLFGANGLFHFMPAPEVSDAGGAFLGALAATGYLFPIITGTKLTAGLLLLSNRWVPFALTLLAPLLVNIVAFHAALSPAGSGAGLVLTAITLALAYSHRASYAPLFASPAVQAPKPTTIGALRSAGGHA